MSAANQAMPWLLQAESDVRAIIEDAARAGGAPGSNAQKIADLYNAFLDQPAIEARGLTKAFGDTQALAGLDLVAESVRVTALLGPNGAGKTTFISAVATLLKPDSGELRVAGADGGVLIGSPSSVDLRLPSSKLRSFRASSSLR